MRPFAIDAVEQAFALYPSHISGHMLALRELIFSTARATTGVGEIDETLKWGEPAYLTTQSKSGSTIRLGWKPSTQHQFGMYFNCRTTLVDSFRACMPNTMAFDGNRAILFSAEQPVPFDLIAHCIEAALTYHKPHLRTGLIIHT